MAQGNNLTQLFHMAERTHVPVDVITDNTICIQFVFVYEVCSFWSLSEVSVKSQENLIIN